MSYQGWPFLVSRNRHLDYRTIVAPDFLCAMQSTTMLARATEGDVTAPGEAFMRHLVGSKAGDLTILYQIRKAPANWLDPKASDEILKDSFGREIVLIVGLVFQDKIDGLSFTQQALDDVLASLKEAFCLFWDQEKSPPVIPSHPHPLSEQRSPPLKIFEVPPLMLRASVIQTPAKLTASQQDAAEALQNGSSVRSNEGGQAIAWLHPRLLAGYGALGLLILMLVLTGKLIFFSRSEKVCEREDLAPITIGVKKDVVTILESWMVNNKTSNLDAVLIVLSGDLYIKNGVPPKARAAIRQSIEEAEKSKTSRGSIVFKHDRLSLTDYPLHHFLRTPGLKGNLYVVNGAKLNPAKYSASECLW